MFYIVIKNISTKAEKLYSSIGYQSSIEATKKIIELGYVKSKPDENSTEFAFVVDDRIDDLEYGASYYSCIIPGSNSYFN